MNKIKCVSLFLSLLLFFCFTAKAENASSQSKNDVNVKDIVLGHITDSYDWHITKMGNTDLCVYLPIIVYSHQTGWHTFLSSHLFPEGTEYEGLRIANEGKYDGKVVEKDASGVDIRPIDISITKTVLALFINSVLLIVIILCTARWHKRRTPQSEAPKGFVGMMEMFIMAIEDDLVKKCIGKDYKFYSPYILTAFFFVLINNLMALIPIFPAGVSVTGNIAITFMLALCTFIAVNVWGNKSYWKDIFWPKVPMWLKAPVPFMPLIELFGIFSKPFALMIRLFANMMGGHSALLALVSLVFITVSMGPLINGTMTVVSVLFTVFMNFIELLVAFIQAYVFAMLSAVFIGLSRMEEATEKK